MAHEIEQFADGSAAFVSARTDAWHRLGTTLPDTFTAEQAMETAHLGGWNVRKSPLHTTIEGQTLEVPGAYATVRTHPKTGQPDVLGYVGAQWQPVQNEELCDFLDVLVDESGAHFETAGSLRDGKNVFITMKLPQTMTIAGTDNLDLYIAGLNSHDGTGSLQAIVSPVRIVCANTQAAALRAAKSKFVIRHTSGVTNKIEEARQALRLTWNYLEEFQAEAEKMIDATLREVDFVNKARRLFPLESGAGKRAKENNDALIAELRRLYTEADTNANIRGSRWAGYQTVVEYLDHYAPIRGADGAQALDMRAERVLAQANIAKVKTAAFDAFAVTK